MGECYIHRAMHTSEGKGDGYFHLFLTTVLEGIEWMVDLLNIRETAYGIHWIGGLVGYRFGGEKAFRTAGNLFYMPRRPVWEFQLLI